MIEQAARDFEIGMADSFATGDKMNDVIAGHRAGCRAILVARESPQNGEYINHPPEHVAPDLREAVKWILKR
ncbi:MAG: hypothetical protein A2Z29_11550 [Chloroflexi bacterium RBG_16_56_11]|nr:MAG: hypothetical protein A2Z29_11550 [Chloroflexi bacterium RBG_16_56_11]